MKKLILATAVVAVATSAMANLEGASKNSAASWNASATQPSAASQAKMAPVGELSTIMTQAPAKVSVRVEIAGMASTKDMTAILLSENKNKMQPSVQNSAQATQEYSQKSGAIFTNSGKKIDNAVLANSGRSLIASLTATGEVLLSAAAAVTSQEREANAAAMRVQLASKESQDAFMKAFNGSMNNVAVTVSAAGEITLATGAYLGKLVLATGQEIAFIASQTGQFIVAGAEFSGAVISVSAEQAFEITKAAVKASVASVEGLSMYVVTGVKNTPAALSAGASATINTIDGIADSALTASVMLVSEAPAAFSQETMKQQDLGSGTIAASKVLLYIPAATVDAAYHAGHQYKQHVR